MVLDADAVEIGRGFIANHEASCYINFKDAVILFCKGDTELCQKKLKPVRLLKNNFYNQVKEQEIII